MAKDTEKLIRQLSLISFLMAEQRPVSALEIRQDVEGYAQMTSDEAFNRRFYADRAELASLGIELEVEKSSEGSYEAETYTLPPENFYLPTIEFSDEELGGLRTALTLLDGEFAYAEPLRLALQQLSWGKPSPLTDAAQQTVRMAMTADSGGRELSQRLSKIETAIFRRKTIVFDYYTLGRDSEERRKVDPYHLLFQGGQFYLVGHSHERDAIRVFRLSRIRGKVGYASKAEHDFQRPEEFDPREYANRADWQLSENTGVARIWLSDRVEWLVRRHIGPDVGQVVEEDVDGGVLFETPYGDARQLIAWVLGLGERARIVEPAELAEQAQERVRLVADRHAEAPELAPAVKRRPQEDDEDDDTGKRESHIRPERFARLVTLAGILIDTARENSKLELRELCERLQISEQELRQDIDVLNVVNFGGGSYVLYAEIQGDQIEVDPEPYGDNFAQPARLLPLEAKALVAAIDLVGEHLPEGSLASARDKIVDALGRDPAADGLQITSAKGDDSEIARVVSSAIADRRLLRIEHYKEAENEFTERTIEPYQLLNGPEGWYVHAFEPAKDHTRSFRLDRIRSADVLDEGFERREGVEPEMQGWPTTGEVPRSARARVWVSPERARWAREDKRVVDELKDGAVVVELAYGGNDYLAREILKEAGDAVVLEPEDAREAVRAAADSLAGATARH
jgi:predicted DNA-binding transcriptional regulator YafY